jgi:hypothetical protein
MLIDRKNSYELLGGEGFGGGSAGAPFSGALVSKNVNQSIPNFANDVLTWQIQRYDVGDWFATPGDEFFTIPAGVSRIMASVGLQWEAVAAEAFRSLSFSVNGVTVPGIPAATPSTLPSIGVSHSICSPVISVTPGDKIRAAVLQISGGDMDAQASDRTYFAIVAAEGFALSGSSFLTLADTPGTYVGEAGSHVRVNAITTGLEFGQAVGIADSPEFAELTTGDLTVDGACNVSRAVFIADADTTVLRRKRIYACVNTAAARTLTIQSADIFTGFGVPWVFTVKDESGGANANNITIVTQGAETIDGAASVAITEDFGSITLYSNGSNLFSI